MQSGVRCHSARVFAGHLDSIQLDGEEIPTRGLAENDSTIIQVWAATCKSDRYRATVEDVAGIYCNLVLVTREFEVSTRCV